VVDAIHAAQGLGVRVSLDPSLEGARSARGRVQAALPEVDFLLASVSELLALSEKGTLDEALAWLSERYSCAAVVKLGGQGSLYQHGEMRCSVPAFSGRVVDDTTGAGDIFNAGFLSGLLNGDDPQTCLRLGNAAAYISVTSGQGIASLIHMPDPLAEMHALMACVN
jgi:sugar/nucleoside kinase (ribokinase family)